MTIVKIKELRSGDIIKSYEVFHDEKWHFVRDINFGGNVSGVYLALEDYGSGYFDGNREVEKSKQRLSSESMADEQRGLFREP